MARQGPPVTFRRIETEAKLDARGTSRGLIAQRDLERYYYALQVELSTVSLTESEAMLIVDVCNGTLWYPHSISLLWAEVDDGIRLDGLDAKWGVDGLDLVANLRKLNYTQSLAIVDATERYWAAVGKGEKPTAQSLGLVR